MMAKKGNKKERFLCKIKGGALSMSLVVLLWKTNGLFAKIEPKLYIFNLL